MSHFSKLVEKLEKEGMSEKEARAVAYKIGVEKYGKKGMENKAKEGKEAKMRGWIK